MTVLRRIIMLGQGNLQPDGCGECDPGGCGECDSYLLKEVVVYFEAIS